MWTSCTGAVFGLKAHPETEKRFRFMHTLVVMHTRYVWIVNASKCEMIPASAPALSSVFSVSSTASTSESFAEQQRAREAASAVTTETRLLTKACRNMNPPKAEGRPTLRKGLVAPV